MEKEIREIIAYHCGGTHEGKERAAKQILALFSVGKCTHQWKPFNGCFFRCDKCHKVTHYPQTC